MKIAIHGRLILPGKMEGIGRFTEEVLIRWAEDHPEDDFFILFDRSSPPVQYEASNIHVSCRGPQARHPILYLWWFERVISPWLEEVNADVFVSPEGFLPLHCPCPCVAVIHDIAHQYYREGIDWGHKLYYDFFMPRFVRRADRIATVSEFSKRTLIETYGTAEEKIDVVYNGCREGFEALSEEHKQAVRKQYGWSRPFFLYLGAIHPRKNLVTLLDAYEIFRRRHHEGPLFVLAGRKAWKTGRFENTLKHHPYRKEIEQLDYVPEEDLPALMGAAEALCYVSHFEGFGLPVLEAMHAEIPIITSNVSSLPEVAGNAALKVAPDDPNAIAQAMGRIYTHEALARQLVEAGRIQRTKFSWEQTANALYQTVLSAQG